MRTSNFRHIFIAAITLFLLSVAALWSVNTVMELFGGPALQFKHAIAVVALLVILRWSPYRRRRTE